MFDVGFPELVLVFIIGLLVLGPERLPKVAAEIGKWVGRARRTATELRRQLEREIELNDIQPPPPAAKTPAQQDADASADAATATEAGPSAAPPEAGETASSAEPPPPAPAAEPAADEQAVATPDGTTTDEATERSPRA